MAIRKIEKICGDCGILKVLDDYYLRAPSANGWRTYRTECKDCTKKRSKAYYNQKRLEQLNDQIGVYDSNV